MTAVTISTISKSLFIVSSLRNVVSSKSGEWVFQAKLFRKNSTQRKLSCSVNQNLISLYAVTCKR